MMKRKVQMLLLSGGIAAALVSAVALSEAGWKNSVAVNISTLSDGNRMVYGTMAGARASAAVNERIGCAIGVGHVSCYAQDARGNVLFCNASSSNPNYQELREAALAAGSDSHIQYTVTPQAECISLWVTNGSDMTPKAP